MSIILSPLLFDPEVFNIANTVTMTIQRILHFQVLIGDVDLGPLSKRPELFKVAAVRNEVVNTTDDQQTAVVTVGVNIRLDWSS